MPKQNADSKKTRGISRVDLIVLPGLTLLLALVLGIAALNQVMPKGPERASTNVTRVARYFRMGQWEADIRTVAAAFRYFVDPDLSPASDIATPPSGGIAVVRSNANLNLPNI